MNKIEICSKALNKIGAIEIDSFEDDTPEAQIASSMYPLVKRKTLSSFAWSFAVKSATLVRIEEVDRDFRVAYALPEDMVRAIKLESGAAYRIVGNKLLTNVETAVLEYIYDAEEENFPPMFAAAIVSSLAAEFAFALIDDGAKFNMMQRQAMTELREARFLETSQGERKRIKNFSLNSARN
ncbi:MAG: hypothetical protein FWD15_04400 [Alphaproteobacteria bacterium]|nr:hypothetical protein [Alphaproteobacteria bacterium]